MKLYTLTKSIQLPITYEEAWKFLSNPGQLEAITSDNLAFKPIEKIPDKMYEGMIISYQIRPLLNIPIHWVTEISSIEEGKRFIDEQRFGPFRFWHHEHQVIENESGVEMKDIIHYVMPFSFIGRIVHRLFIRKMLQQIFDYRKEKIEAYFK